MTLPPGCLKLVTSYSTSSTRTHRCSKVCASLWGSSLAIFESASFALWPLVMGDRTESAGGHMVQSTAIKGNPASNFCPDYLSEVINHPSVEYRA